MPLEELPNASEHSDPSPFQGLPRGSSSAPSSPTAEADPRATLLVVDDEPAVRRVLVMRLQMAGYRVLCAEDGEEALALFHREQPDLVVLDVMMPKLDGFAVCRQLRAESCVPIREPGRVVPRAEILEQLWGYPPRRAADLRVVDVYVARLRGKLEPDPRNPELILTVRGTGYASQRIGDPALAAAG